jgi:hypothetical protein
MKSLDELALETVAPYNGEVKPNALRSRARPDWLCKLRYRFITRALHEGWAVEQIMRYMRRHYDTIRHYRDRYKPAEQVVNNF